MDAPAILARIRNRLRTTVVLGGAARLIAVAIAGTAAALVIDRVWFLPGWLRLGVLLFLLGGLSLIAWRRLIRPLRQRLPDRELATFAERRVPALDGRLFAAVDGIPLGATDTNALAAALPGGIERVLVPASHLPRLATVAALALLAVVVSAALAPAFWSDGLRRLALPLGAADWTRSAALSGSVEREVVASDEQVVLLLERRHGLAAPVQVAWDDGHGQTGRRQLTGLDGPWRQSLALGPGDWHLRAWSADSHPVHLRARVVERPRLMAIRAVLTPPAYSGLPEVTLATAACQALPGSRLAFTATFAAPAGRQVVTATATAGGMALDLSHGTAGWSATETITTAHELILDASDQDGIALLPPARFPIAIEPDRPPQVSLSGPNPDETVGPRARVAVALDATDDLGLAQVRLTAAVGGTATALIDAPVERRTTASATATVDVAALASPGATITLVGTATDRNDVSGPGTGASRPLVLKVVPEDELRRDLERRLGEARERVVQARTHLAPLLAGEGRPADAARSAAAEAARAAEQAGRTHRRWLENGLPEADIAPAAEAALAAGGTAPPHLAKAAAGDREAARAADAALEQAERALDRILSENDLARILADLIRRTEALHGESRGFVREYLTKALDAAGKTRQADLAGRQRELAGRVSEAERRILAAPAALDAAKAIVRSEGPADRLEQAAVDLASDANRSRAITSHQTAAIASLKKLLEALRGSDAAAQLAQRLGELAARQEKLAEAIQQGAPEADALREQSRLAEETQRLAETIPDAEAKRSAQAANGAQQGAIQGLGGGDRRGAGRDAETAANLLREAQRRLDPRAQSADQDKQDSEQQPDVLALLRALEAEQQQVLADSLPVHRRISEDEPDFAAKRDLAAIAQRQDDILLRLTEEGLKRLEQQPIATAALQRVAMAMRSVLKHLKTPALGERGLRLERIALYELQRLLAVAASLPQPKPNPDPQGGGGGQANQAPFPPAAEIGLLMARQDEIGALTAGGRPADVAAMQSDLAGLVSFVHQRTRPGSRPEVLMARAHRAAATAAALLADGKRGTETRHHQIVARESLRQLLLEAKASNSSGKSSGKQQPQQPGQQQPQAAPPTANGQPGQGTPAQAAQGGTQQVPGTGSGTAVGIPQEHSGLMQLPPAARDRLNQSRHEPMPPGGVQIFERYLEKLEP